MMLTLFGGGGRGGDGGGGGGLLRRFIQTKAKQTNPNFSSGENKFKKLLSFI